MATPSSVLAWRIPGTGEPGGLPSMGSHRVGHDWSDLAAAAMQETSVRSLGWEDPLEKWLATHSSVLAWRIPWTEDTGGLQSKVFQRVRQDWATNTFKTFLVAQTVKHLSTMRGTQVCSLGGKDLLEKEMATHSSILAWKIPWTEDLVDYCPWGRKESDTTAQFYLSDFERRWAQGTLYFAILADLSFHFLKQIYIKL